MNDLNNKLCGYYSDIDKDKVWEKISRDLDFPPEELNETPRKPVIRRKNNLLPALSAAAVIIVTAAVGSIFPKYNSFSDNASVAPAADNSVRSDDAVRNGEEEPANAADEYKDEIFFPSENGWDYSSVSLSSAKSYNYSDFDSSLSPSYEINRSDDFFVEADILENADFFLDCIVNEISDVTEENVTYKVSPVHVICPEDMTLSPEVEIISSRSYVMTEGKEYLLPIKESDGRFMTADSSSPKILLADGFVLYQNGWASLSGGSEQYLTKDRASPDDFFYDRMFITEEKSLQRLFDRFYEVKK